MRKLIRNPYVMTLVVYIIVIGFIMWASDATASDDPYDIIFIDGHIASLHTQTEFDVEGEHYSLNQVNFGLGVTFPVYSHLSGKANANASYRFGFYKNSYNDMSLYGGVDLHTKYTNGFGAGFMFGLVNGYENSPNGTDTGFAMLPHVQYIYNDYKIEMAYLHSGFAPALTLTISYKY